MSKEVYRESKNRQKGKLLLCQGTEKKVSRKGSLSRASMNLRRKRFLFMAIRVQGSLALRNCHFPKAQ